MLGNEERRGISRRRFIRDTSGLAVASVVGAIVPSRRSASRRGTVAVLGGGVAGLSAAHELVERGFDVTVYERKALGGKARSMPVPGSAKGGRPGLPGEHGFRFFPGFYWNLGDTLRRIPYGNNPGGVHDNLRRASIYRSARTGGRADATVPLSAPPVFTPADFLATLQAGFETMTRLGPGEAEFFARKAFVYVTSHDERRLGQWEHVSWAEFTDVDRKSEEYRKAFADGLTRNLAATRSSEASTHSIGLVGEATILSAMGLGNEPGATVDRVLNGPTSEAWLDPWVAHLTRLGVRFEVGWSAQTLTPGRGRIVSATLRNASGRPRTITADWYVCAMPVQNAVRLLSPALLRLDPALGGMRRLRTDWMNGLLFYLRRPLPLTHGHVNYVDSPWAVSSISQAQFWDAGLHRYGDGTVAESLSTIISDWAAPGILYKRAARDCTPREIMTETWAQLKAHLNDGGSALLTDDLLHSWFLDPAIVAAGTPRVTNDEPLFIQHPGSWTDRPHSATGVPNLFLAGDWVRTSINVTTMEGANAGARQAVNAVLDAAGSSADRCSVHDLYRPPEFEALKLVDRERYRSGQANLFDTW